MPSLMKACSHIGCGGTSPGRYCADHVADARSYEKDRPSSARRLYGRAWTFYRRSYLRANLLCVSCGAPATRVDHKVPHRGDLNKFWDPLNHQPMCESDHNAKSQRERIC